MGIYRELVNVDTIHVATCMTLPAAYAKTFDTKEVDTFFIGSYHFLRFPMTFVELREVLTGQGADAFMCLGSSLDLPTKSLKQLVLF